MKKHRGNLGIIITGIYFRTVVFGFQVPAEVTMKEVSPPGTWKPSVPEFII